MNPLVETFLKSAQAEGLAFSLADDLDDLIALHDLANAATQTKPTREYAAQLRPVLHIGGLALRRLSIGAATFHDQRLQEWFPEPTADYWLSMFYLLAEGRDPDKVWGEQAASLPAWLAHVRIWARPIRVPFDELIRAVHEFLAVEERIQEHATQEDKADTDLGGFLEELTAEHGHEPKYWTWAEDQETTKLLMHGLRTRQSREAGHYEGSRADWLFQQKRAAIREKLQARKSAVVSGDGRAGAVDLSAQRVPKPPGIQDAKNVQKQTPDRELHVAHGDGHHE